MDTATKKLARSNAVEDSNVPSPVRLVNSQTRPALSSQLSKDSTGYTDATGIDILSFIKETLHKNMKDRQHILHLEKVFSSFISDQNSRAYQFPNMTSYDRMIVHRVAAFFGLDHNVTQDGQSVVVTKTDYATVPILRFDSLIEHNNFAEKLRRHSNSRFGKVGSAWKSQDLAGNDVVRRTRSMDIPSGSIFQPLPLMGQQPLFIPRTRNATVPAADIGEGLLQKVRMPSMSSTTSDPCDVSEPSPVGAPIMPSCSYNGLYYPSYQYPVPLSPSIPNPAMVPQNAYYIAGPNGYYSYYVPGQPITQQFLN